MAATITDHFSLVRGGPAHRLQQRLGLLADDLLPTLRTAVTIALVAWLPLAALAALDQRNWSLQYDSSFFADFVAYARYLLAIPIMIISDRSSDNRIRGLVDNFVKSGIIPADSLPIFGQMLRQADTRTASAPAEGAMLVLAFVLAAVTAYQTAELGAGQRVTGVADHSRGLSPAGWWNLLVSAPLFFFITLRWFWRFTVWAALLKRISRLPLQLVASHPDRSGGLGFLTLFPMIFWPWRLH